MIEQLVRKFLYYPVILDPSSAPPAYAAGSSEVWTEAEDGNRIHSLYWPAPEGRPTILFFHGNAQSVFEWALVREDFSAADCGLLLVDYPGYGKSTGTPSEAGLYAAGRAALNWLIKEAGIGEGQIIVFGKSLGGGVASEIVQGKKVKGLVLESTFRSIPSVAQKLLPFIPADAVMNSERYETAGKLSRIAAPVLVIHGSRDELIPLEEGLALYELANDPKELYLVENAGHNDVSMMAGPGYGLTIRSWLDRLK